MLTFIRTLATSALFAIAAMSANAVTVDLNDLSLGNGTNIETGAPGFGDDGPVTLNWNPTGNPSRTLVFWNGAYSGRDAAYCSGINCTLDLIVAAGFTITLDNFSLGGWPNADRNITWSVIDLFDNSIVASATAASVSGVTGLLNTRPRDLLRPVGFRIQFGPDGFNGGLTEVNYTHAPRASVIPVPASLPLMVLALGGLGLVARRRTA